MASLLVRALLVLVCAFAALSSSVAAALELSEERMLAFTGLVCALLLVPFLARPRLVDPGGPILVLAALALGMVLAGMAGDIALVDAKLLLPVLVLLAAPNLARFLSAAELTRFVWRLLSTYVALTFAYQVLAEPAVVARGYGDVVRYDPTGSVVMHSSLSTIHLVLAATRLGGRPAWRHRLATLALGGMSLSMVLLTATRTALVTLTLFALLNLATSAQPLAAFRRLAPPLAGFALAFAGWSLLVDRSFWLRLIGAQGEFSSGRSSSIDHWLSLAGDHPWGIGLGRIRASLADGRPALGSDELLEWPHDEFVRLYVEAGPPGLLFVVLLMAILARRALRAARHTHDPSLRALILVILADLVAEACLQNLLNAVYHATVLVLILSLAVARSRDGSAPPAAVEPLAQGLASR